jgi:hypothetical protein
MRQIEPTVESYQGRLLETVHQRRVQKVDMEMQNIELVRLPPNFVQHDNVVGHRVSTTTGFMRRAKSEHGTSLADVLESPLANSVTSWPWRTSSSVR